MIVYRLSRTRWANDLTGEGSRLHGGRWNHPGTACLYTSESRALAILEYTVNVNVDDIPRSLSMVTLEIPDDFADFPAASLPGDWKQSPSPVSTKDFGTKALKARAHPTLRFPSIVVPREFNYILNP
ncbi:MAG TPA: RES family NAD+ phosphorylase, partial [Chryseolinea sp.]|nr:RES family NAD+ phosphorylase [Chryseolinea sp.]